MSLRQRAGAPRLIEWTGERCVPWTPDVQVVYEHMHRYLWAAELVGGRRVLELGSGEGFGASILADGASEVLGIDVDERTVEHARLNWSGLSLSFEVGSALDLSAFDDGSFDAVVAFEIIEHVVEQEQMLAEARRVLTNDGLLIVSTPDRRLYSETTGQNNPFHERELTREEFSNLLEKSFEHVAIWGQRTITGSHLGAVDPSVVAEGSPHADFFVERTGEEWRVAGEPTGLYLVALASNSSLPDAPSASTLGDCGLELVRESERESARVVSSVLAERDEAVERKREAVERERAALAVIAEERLKAVTEHKQLNVELGHRDERTAHLQKEIRGVQDRLGTTEITVGDLRRQLEDSQRLTRQVEASVTWQLFQRVRGRVFSSVGETSLSVRALRLLLRLGGRLMSRRNEPDEPDLGAELPVPHAEVINLPTFERPTVSLVIPLHSRGDLTRRCLESIRDNTDQVGYEVILIDDQADSETKMLLEVVSGARLVVNEENEGYLRSVNRGAAIATGKWLVLCNNDIEVQPVWLKAMLDCAESRDSVGIVAPKYVSPDGRLSEAGGILWNDGTGLNYGRGDDPHQFQYQFTREIDYGSAAALMVRSELWREIGGYDNRFEPMYYEDADLCLEARARGWRVFYEPTAAVVHVEGATAGTDPQAGHKRHQETNRLKFVEKWQEVLEAEHLQSGERQVRRAANRHRGAHVLVVDFRVPMWDRDAGSLRMYEILQSLLRLGCGVTFLPDNFAPIEPYTRDLQRLGIEVIYGPVDLLAEFADIGPGLAAAILSRPHSASRWLDSIREFAPSALVLYDTVDLHWVRESRRFALGKPTPFAANGAIPAQGPKAAALRELELALVRASDMTITVTENERAQIESQVPDARVVVIPTVHEISHYVPQADGRSGVLFVGGFEHPPNVDAAIYLVREIMPHVWTRLGDVSVTIVGGSPPKEVIELASSRVDVTGWIAELEPLLDSARALVVPVRFGAGVKGKITQGLAAGLPVVTTSLGAEGLDGMDGENMLIGEDVDALAQRIVRVVEDDELWQSLSSGGQDLVATKCSLAVLEERLREVLAASKSGAPASPVPW